MQLFIKTDQNVFEWNEGHSVDVYYAFPTADTAIPHDTYSFGDFAQDHPTFEEFKQSVLNYEDENYMGED